MSITNIPVIQQYVLSISERNLELELRPVNLLHIISNLERTIYIQFIPTYEFCYVITHTMVCYV